MSTDAQVVDRAEIKDGAVLVEYSRTEAALADLRTKYKDAAFDLTGTAGDKAARAARKELVDLRTTLEKTRKQFKAPALEFGRKIDAEAARITVEIVELEAPIDEQIKADEARREAERQAKAEVERQRVAAIRAKINAISAVLSQAAGAKSEAIAALITQTEAKEIGAEFAELVSEAEDVKAGTLDRLADMFAAALAAEREKAEREAEAARLAAERDEQQRVAAEQAKRQRELEAEAERIAAEARAQAAKAAAEQAEQARQLAAQQAAIEAQARAVREAQEAEQRRIDSERAELERQQAAAAAASVQAEKDKAEAEAKRAAEEARIAAEKAAAKAAKKAKPLTLSQRLRIEADKRTDEVDLHALLVEAAMALEGAEVAA